MHGWRELVTHAKVTPHWDSSPTAGLNDASWAANLYSAYGIKKEPDFVGITTILNSRVYGTGTVICRPGTWA